MKRFLKVFVACIMLVVLMTGTAMARTATQPAKILEGAPNNWIPIESTYEWGSSANRWEKIWANNIDVTSVTIGTLTTGITDTQVVYSNAGALAGDAGLTYDAATDTLTSGTFTDGTASITGGAITGATTINTHTVPAGTSTFALWTDKLSAFAATTSAELFGVISDETGTGSLVGANTPTLVTPEIGAATGTSLATTNTTYGDRAITSATGGVFDIGLGSAAGDDFTVDTSALVVEGDTGYVGIGTAAPGAKLHTLVGSMPTEPTWAATSDVAVFSGDATPRLHIHSGTTGAAGLWFTDTTRGTGRIDYDFNNDAMSFWTSGTRSITIDSTGSVGIGAASPGNKLHVTASTSGGITIDSAVSSGYSELMFGDSTDSTSAYIQYRHSSNAADPNDIRFVNQKAGDIHFYTNNLERTTISSAGEVGIGIASPRSILDVDKGTGYGQLTLDGSTGGCIMLRDTDDAGWTECSALDGTLTCTLDADGICDGA